ncbi:MAG: type II toxin-antitoxin system HicA family toxin [Candidatus Diapherotrites archaeon]
MKIPAVSGKKIIKLLTRQGFEIAGKKGSHVRLKKRMPGRVLVTVVPLHKRLDTGTLLAILRQCEISKEMLKKGL